VFVAGFLAGVIFSAWKMGETAPAESGKGPKMSEKNSQDDLRKRIAGLERMLVADPNNHQALVQLANDYFDTGNFEKAVETYNKALQIDPRDPDVLTDMGIAYRRLGKPQDSVNAFRRAIDVDGDHALALFNLGIVLRDDLKDDRGALEAWERFLQKAGDSPHAVMVQPWVKSLRQKLGSSAQPQKSNDDKK